MPGRTSNSDPLDELARLRRRISEIESREARLPELEASLREAQRRYAMVAAAGHVGVWELDLGADQFYIDPWLKQRLGYGEDEIPNDRRAWSRHMHEEDRALMASAVRACAEGRSGAIEAEHRMVCRDGSICWLHAQGIALRAPDGRVARIVGTCVDITGRKHAEDESTRLKSELEERVRSRTAELQASLGELESFSYSVSHDLRSPLRAINGYSHLLLAEYAAALDENGQTYLKRICAATERMGGLIDNLLALSRISLAETRTERVDLSRIAEDVLAGLREHQPERDLSVVVEPGLVAEGDPSLLRVLLENLLANAWKFTGRIDRPEIEFGRCESERGKPFFVRDNGAGFDLAFADKLFKPFQRMHAANDFPGSGIGLATVKRVVERHGGRLWVDAAVGRGATFYFTLSAKEHGERRTGGKRRKSGDS